MKKTLLLAAGLLLAATTLVNAQRIVFTEFAKGSTPKQWANDGVVLTPTDTKGKMEGTTCNRTFSDGQQFYSRLKTGGRSLKDNGLTLHVPAQGTVTIYATSGSKEEDRSLLVRRGSLIYLSEVLNLSLIHI